MNVESPWFKKVLSEIKDLDRKKREMEKNFSWDKKEDYNDIVRKETVEAVDLLKFGAENRVEGDNVVLTVGEDVFRIPKDILSDELGADQYNLLVNNAEEEPDDVTDVEEEDNDNPYQQKAAAPVKSAQTQSADIRLPDGRKVPASLAPMLLFTQAMEKTLAAYTGTPTEGSPGFGLISPQPQVKVKSKTTGELLRNIADLQQQVLAIEDEKERVLSGDNKELEETRTRNKELETAQKQAEDTIAMLKSQLSDAERSRSEESSRTAAKIKEATDLLQKKEKELSDTKSMLGATQAQIKGIRQSSEADKEAAEKRVEEAEAKAREQIEQAEKDFENKQREAVENATKAAQDAILKQKEGEISSLEADFHMKLSDLKSEYEAKVKDLQDKNSENADKISSLSADKDALSADKEKAIADAKAEYEHKLSELNKSHAEEIDKLKAERDASADKVKEEIEKKFQSQIKDLTKQKEQAESELGKLKSSSKDMQKKISLLRDDAFTDLLTGLKNERALNNDFREYPTKTVARVSILGMKLINDGQGIETGNSVITMVADELGKDFPGRTYRTMGDQFVILNPKDNTSAVEKKIAALADSLSEQEIYIAFGVASGDNAYDEATKKTYEMRAAIYSESEEGDPDEEEISDDADEDTIPAEDESAKAEEEPEEEDGSEDGDSDEDSSYDDEDEDDEEDENLAEQLSQGTEI